MTEQRNMFDPRALPAELLRPGDVLAARFEDAGLNASAPAEQFLYDGWLLRGSPGKAKRARSVNIIGASRLPTTEKVAHVEAWYRRRGLPAIFRITPFSADRALDDELARHGFSAQEDTRVMHVPLASAPQAWHRAGIKRHDADARTFADAVGALRESPPEQIEAHAARLVGSTLSAHRLLLHASDEPNPLACGQIVVEGGLAGIYDVVVAPAMRARGLATYLVSNLLTDAFRLGVRHVYLQVSADNDPARALYRSFGFVDSYAYWYRIRGVSE